MGATGCGGLEWVLSRGCMWRLHWDCTGCGNGSTAAGVWGLPGGLHRWCSGVPEAALRMSRAAGTGCTGDVWWQRGRTTPEVFRGCSGRVRCLHGGGCPRGCPWGLRSHRSPTRVPLRNSPVRERGSQRRPPGLGREERPVPSHPVQCRAVPSRGVPPRAVPPPPRTPALPPGPARPAGAEQPREAPALGVAALGAGARCLWGSRWGSAEPAPAPARLGRGPPGSMRL